VSEIYFETLFKVPEMDNDLTLREKISVVFKVFSYRPLFTLGLIVFSSAAALLEGFGLSFIEPIFRISQTGVLEQNSQITQLFRNAYNFLGISFTLETLILAVSLVMTVRFSSSFIISWMKARLGKQYESDLRKKAFEAALNAEIGFFDRNGMDRIINHVLTETTYSSKLISVLIGMMERLFLILIYLLVMAYLSIRLTFLAFLMMATITLFIRYVLDPAASIGSKVADANEAVQKAVQSGILGIREIKLFGLKAEIFSEFSQAINDSIKSEIKMVRNETFIDKFYRLSAALTLFLLIYLGIEYEGLNFSQLGIFILALYRMSGKVSSLNSRFYKMEGYMAHFIRVQEFFDQLANQGESSGSKEIEQIDSIRFEDVSFSYGDEEALKNISFEIEKGEFKALVGKSGAGKSTVASLLTRMYHPTDGKIVSEGISIQEYGLESWREKFAVVRQKSFIFNDTLRENVKIGRPEASEDEIMEACKIAEVDEFLDDLPNGIDSRLGDDGVKLSGGQRQRVAIARALIRDADFLILDEATSDLDSDLEKKVQKAVERSDTEYGILAIAHRLSTIKDADKIYSFENGEIVEEGTHSELLEKGGVYSRLYNIQSEEN
jgi:subfamily B ATP-binding cassette protein MsbA